MREANKVDDVCLMYIVKGVSNAGMEPCPLNASNAD